MRPSNQPPVADTVYNFTYFNDRTSANLVPYLTRSVFDDFELGKSLTDYDYRMSESDEGSCTLYEELLQFRYVHAYIVCRDFTSDFTLCDTSNDAIVYSVFSILLSWSRPKILRFAKFSKIRVARLVEDVLSLNREGLLHVYKGAPICLQTFRILRNHRHFDRTAYDYLEKPLYDTDSTGTGVFNINKYVTNDLKLHFQRALLQVQNESWTDGDLTDLLNVNETYGIPFAPLIDRSFDDSKIRPKYITGVACTGKTSMLRELHALGWIVRSRGQLGTFGGKSRAPAYVASLHGALDYSYRKYADRVIGDRGPIDNPLWTIIMQLCDPKYKHTMIKELLTFFDRTFNELVIRYHGEYRVAVFLDTRPSRNRVRMLKRGESGDALRGRIAQYVEAQFAAYYMFAALFGFKIVSLPYTKDGLLDTTTHSKNARDLCKYFGKPSSNDTHTDVFDVSKLDNDVPDILKNYNYSKSLGIFK